MSGCRSGSRVWNSWPIDDPRLKRQHHEIEGVGFYTEQGWGSNIFVPTTSRIDSPQVGGGGFADSFKVGQKVEFRGMAFGGDKGISQVEISTDGGKTYASADIDQPGTKISWSLWRYEWTPTEGRRRGARVCARGQWRGRAGDRAIPRPGAARCVGPALGPRPGRDGMIELE